MTEKIPGMPGLSAVEAFTFYEEVRHRLPKATFPLVSKPANNILEIAEHADVFVFDAYGVLNVGLEPVAGARTQIDHLRALGKQVFILTNGASLKQSDNALKFANLGYEFTDYEIISSRAAAELSLQLNPLRSGDSWGVIARDDFNSSDLEVSCNLLTDVAEDYDQAAAFLFLGASQWNEQRQQLLAASLAAKPRRLIVANPDVVAPHGGAFSTEPGYFGHRLADQLRLEVEFHGKPFTSVFELVEQKCRNVLPGRIFMVGDTLHTDILGGRAHGWQTVLVTDHGLFKGLQVNDFIVHSAIVPDWILPSI